MDALSADLALQAVLGRAGDFVGGIDNEALDFSQLEAFINSEGSQGNGSYFGDSLATTAPSSGKLLNVIVENKRVPGHSLPESPPDSSSEHPYSPQDTCEQNLNNSETIYTTLGQPLYKPTLLNPIISDNLILGSHIVVTEQNPDQTLLENGNILINDDLRINNTLQNEGNLVLTTEGDGNRQVLIQQGGESNGNYAERPILVENCTRNDGNLLRLVKGGEYEKAQLVHLGYGGNVELQGGVCEPGLENVQNVYTNLQNAPKKRKLSQDVPLVKSEPEHCSPGQLSPPGPLSAPVDDEYAASESCLSESQYQCIRFQPFQQSAWHALCDQNLTELPVPHYRVDADKGFNFSNADDAFVCQKKNHFQITCHVQLLGDAQFVKTPDGIQKISSFHLHFYGVKHDCPTQTIRVEQSQSDRSKKPFHPVLVELVNSQVTKVTVGRLHFSETTSNNMRKKGKPNPEQRYFQLVVGLHAHTSHGNFPVISHASQKIIVRASNPGQFESDVELCWQKGQTQDSIYHAGKVGVNTDRPDESLVVHGNLKITGHIIQPSDIRAKKNIVECDTAEQLRNVQRLRVVRYEYEPGFASQLNRNSESSDTGVIAQEVAEVLPEAVSPAGDVILENGTSIDNFLVVNKERIFMENIGAVKELCKVTDNLETRIDQLERINRRLSKLKRGDSLKSTSTVNSTKLGGSNKCHKHHSCHSEADFCSNKFIQIIIVVLVLIMAFCLAAITTLYLMETAKYGRQFSQATLHAAQGMLPTKRPVKSTKLRNYQTVPTTLSYKGSGVTRVTVDTAHLVRGPSSIIGRPPECGAVEQDLENSNLCQIYCCVPPPLDSPRELENPLYTDKRPSVNQNKTAPLLSLEKDKITKPFHSNDIEKQLRQRRDTYNLPESEIPFDNLDDNIFLIIVQGKTFNTTLTSNYIYSNSPYNISFTVPISKYMPDEFVNLIFRPLKSNIKEIENCYNHNNQCPYSVFYADGSHKINEKSSFQHIGSQSVAFEVDMVGFRTKFMTYRATLRQVQNVCKLSSNKLGVEFIEYNFYFHRFCDE